MQNSLLNLRRVAISFVAISMNRAIGEKTGPKRRIVSTFWSLKLIYLSEDGKDSYLKL